MADRIALWWLDGRPAGTRIVASHEGQAPVTFIRRHSALGNLYWADVTNEHGSHLLSADLIAMRFDDAKIHTPEETP